ncbi:protein kinase domain protein [Ichthyophthirius multifiliis]|uniref:non-specific serine/threonine protein kinase n=1 Tax=Ichthyophthirius multifiliis TaxID=5932 RepID=G0QY58_ICHMU|nr:protein kinase domain protein [Ichthyophthirius multifiliis]EGR29846.1 protein kinase domain protein [Ichthyophthirius multifiliis]|eukprot:XP_004031082.1 protein kinase domain protein [Ichthyophthirius multifiliis]
MNENNPSHQAAEYELYKRIKLLGEGAFGKAYLVEDLQTHELLVQKQMDTKNMSQEEKKETQKEAKILQALNHPNIVKFKEVYTTKKGKLCIIMEYADGGDIGKIIKESKGKYLNENQIIDWFTQICLALKHVHDRKIIHRDLKGQNIFLTKNNLIKLGDFGIARVLTKTIDKAKTMVGTPYYLSPEIIESKPYSFKTDIWSLGVILYELCALRPPFNAESLHFLALKIVKGQYPPIPLSFSKETKNLISQLLQVDPQRRPTITEILKIQTINERVKKFLTEAVRQIEFSHTILHNKKCEHIEQDESKLEFPGEELLDNNNKDIINQKNEYDNTSSFILDCKIDQDEEQSINVLVSGYSALEELILKIEQSLGEEKFKKAYNKMKLELNKYNELDELEKKYGQNKYRDVLDFFTEDEIDKYLRLIITLIIMEENLAKNVN